MGLTQNRRQVKLLSDLIIVILDKKNLLCTILLSFTFSYQAFAISSTASLSPMILLGFKDFTLSGEIIPHPKNTAIFNVTYNESN